MTLYRFLWPLIRLLPAEWAHNLGLQVLKLPIHWAKTVEDPFTWNGLTFRNRIGIAAGFDKNAVALRGVERLGVGFIEIGTVLVQPWPGQPDRPRLKRLLDHQAIWNRLGFPSEGVEVVEQRLARYPKDQRQGLLIGCNIGPHPGHLKSANSPEDFLNIAFQELQQLLQQLHRHCDFFVINLSSPNTPGLRGMLRDRRLATELIAPLKRALVLLDHSAQRPHPTPLLLKLPPDDPDRVLWTKESLQPIIQSLLDEKACDGFVAVNTSTHLTQQLMNQDAGGISGQPLLPIALDSVRMLRTLVGPNLLIIGCGGITKPEDANAHLTAGANLVELYSGMIYHGPGLPTQCALTLSNQQPTMAMSK